MLKAIRTTGQRVVKEIPRETLEAAHEAVRKLREKYRDRLVSVLLYGSVARGERKERSDLDLFIVLKGPFRFVPMRREVYDLLSGVKKGVEVSPLLMEVSEAKKLQPIYFELYADGIILYDKGHFMEDIMDRTGEIIKSLGSERYRTKDGCYGWILKKGMKRGDVVEAEL